MANRSDATPPPQRQSTSTNRQARRRLFLAAGFAVAAIGAAVFSACLVMQPRHPSAVSVAIANATPEVAALLVEADEVARGTVELFPDDPHACHGMAWLHSRYGKAEDAIRYWQRSAQLDPSWDVPPFSIGLITEERGEHQLAAEQFRRAMKLDPKSPVYPVYCARALTEAGDLKKAANVLTDTVRSHSGSVAVRVMLGETYLQMQDYAKAREQFESAIALAPDLATPYYGLGTACARLGDESASQRYLEKFRELKARDAQAHRDELKATKDNIVSVRADVSNVYVEAAKVFLGHGDFDRGEKYLRRASTLDETNAASYRALAWLHEQQGRPEESLATLKTGTERAPHDLALIMTLGRLAAQLKRYDEAEAAYTKAIEMTPHAAGGYAALADLYLRADRNLPRARQLAERAVALEPHAESYFLLSAICQRLGDRAAARAAIDEALQREPTRTEYYRFRQEIESSYQGG